MLKLSCGATDARRLRYEEWGLAHTHTHTLSVLQLGLQNLPLANNCSLQETLGLQNQRSALMGWLGLLTS